MLRRSEAVALFLCECKQWLLQYIYEDRETVVKFAAGVKFTLSHFLFTVGMDSLADEVRARSKLYLQKESYLDNLLITVC